jgi:circadian clock protein KaiB
MKNPRPRLKDKSEAFDKALRSDDRSTYMLKLYVTGTTPRSMRAIDNIKKICEEHLKGRYRLEVIDIYQQPELAAKEQLVVAPTLIRKLPLPLRTFIGDLSETEKILVGLDLRPRAERKSAV